jgi:hypothetical protein
MSLTFRHDLMKQTPLALNYAETSTPFHCGNGNREETVADRVHKILMLALICFDRWLKPLLSPAEGQTLSPIQEHDPYVEGLLRCLLSHRRD